MKSLYAYGNLRTTSQDGIDHIMQYIMTYIVNYFPQGCSIARGCNELATQISYVHRHSELWLQSIVPVNYCEWLYIAYEFDNVGYITKPFRSHLLQEKMQEIDSEKGMILGIYQFIPGIHQTV